MQLLLIALLILTALPALGSTVTGGSVTGGSVRAAGGGGPPVANCTDDSTCLCDTITASYPDVFFCEDFELPTLANTVDSQNGWHTLYTEGGIRGTDNNCLIDDSDPATFRAGFLGDAEAEAAGQACMAHSYEGNCEVAGETDCVENGSGGTYSLGHRMQPGRTQGITGRAPWGTTAPRFGVTMLMKYSSNMVLPDGNPTGAGPAFKHNEFGRGDHAIMGFVGYANGGLAIRNAPFAAGIWTEFGTSTPSMTKGQAETVFIDGAGDYTYYSAVSPDYSSSSDFGLGNWGCFQYHVDSIGSSAATIRFWFNEALILQGTFDLDDLDGPFDADEAGFDRHAWNNYYNGPSIIDVDGDGYPGSTVAYRWEDNVVITSAAEPVPCGAISSSWPAP